MVNKIRTCVFISGNGTNLKSLIKNSKKKKFPISVELVITNNKNAKGILVAKKNKISYKFISSKNKMQFEKKSLIEIKKKKITFICLAGFMVIFSKKFILDFGNKIVNMHPSLLPKFKGLNTHERVLDSRDKYSGCTVHFVNSLLDSVKIILQKKVLIKKNETEKSLKRKVLRLEHIAYPRAIISIFE